MTQIWRETFSNIRYSGLIGILSIIVIILTTMVLTTLLMIANYVHTELNVLKRSPLIVVFLKDGWDDLYVMKRVGRNQLLRNRGDGTFVDIAPGLG